MNSYLEITRPKIWLLVGLFVFIGALISGSLSILVCAAILSGILVAAGGAIFNDYLDRKHDNINKKHRPIPSGRITPRNALYFGFGLLLIGFLSSMYVSPLAIVITFFNIIFVLAYSTHFRYYHLFGNFITSYLFASSFILGASASGNLLPSIFLATFFLLLNTAREILFDIKNYRTDRAYGLRTVPVLYGVSHARTVSSVFLLGAISTLPLTFYYGVYGKTFMAIALGSIAILLYSIYQNIKDSNSEKVGQEISWASIIGVAAYIVGSLI